MYCDTKPPIIGLSRVRIRINQDESATYPNTGPAKGEKRNKLIATARSFGRNTSTLVPPPTAKTGLPARPANNRHTQRLVNDLEKPAPRMKSMKIGADTKYTILRPWPSLSGAVRMGPIARPSVYVVIPRIATVRETPKSSMMFVKAGEYIDVPVVTAKPSRAGTAAW